MCVNSQNGVFFTKILKLCVKKQDPINKSQTIKRGSNNSLEDNLKVLVRIGSHSALSPSVPLIATQCPYWACIQHIVDPSVDIESAYS